MFKKSVEELRRLLELRRSNASRPVKNKKKYTRKNKHKSHIGKSMNYD